MDTSCQAVAVPQMHVSQDQPNGRWTEEEEVPVPVSASCVRTLLRLMWHSKDLSGDATVASMPRFGTSVYFKLHTGWQTQFLPCHLLLLGGVPGYARAKED